MALLVISPSHPVTGKNSLNCVLLRRPESTITMNDNGIYHLMCTNKNQKVISNGTNIYIYIFMYKTIYVYIGPI